jgi:hypothetical protein
MAWVFAPDLTFRPQSQAYSRIGERLYLFESFDGSGFKDNYLSTKTASSSTTPICSAASRPS